MPTTIFINDWVGLLINMDRTNYSLLSLVAIVAIVSMVSMLVSSHRVTPLSFAPSIIANAITDVPRSGSVTGFVTAGDDAKLAQPSASPFDLDGDGIISSKDSDVLALVIDRVQFCPRNKRCDVNGDGVVDLADLGSLNSLVLSQQLSQNTVGPAAQQSSSANDDALSIATTGAIGQ